LNADGSLDLFSDPADSEQGRASAMGRITRAEIYGKFGMHLPVASGNEGPEL